MTADALAIGVDTRNSLRNGLAAVRADDVVGTIVQILVHPVVFRVFAPAGVGNGRLGIAADTGIAVLEHTIRWCLIIIAILIKGLDKMVGAINRGIDGAGVFKVSSGSKCSGDHGHCHHSGQKDRCNTRNSLLSSFHKTTSKLFCVSEKEESLSRYNTFLFFWQNARTLHARSAEKLPEKQVQKRRRPAQEDAGCCSAFRAACRPRRIRSCSISTWELSSAEETDTG